MNKLLVVGLVFSQGSNPPTCIQLYTVGISLGDITNPLGYHSRTLEVERQLSKSNLGKPINIWWLWYDIIWFDWYNNQQLWIMPIMTSWEFTHETSGDFHLTFDQLDQRPSKIPQVFAHQAPHHYWPQILKPRNILIQETATNSRRQETTSLYCWQSPRCQMLNQWSTILTMSQP